MVGCVRSHADRKKPVDIALDQKAGDGLSAIPNQVRREDKAPVSLLDSRKLLNTCRFHLAVAEFPI